MARFSLYSLLMCFALVLIGLGGSGWAFVGAGVCLILSLVSSAILLATLCAHRQ